VRDFLEGEEGFMKMFKTRFTQNVTKDSVIDLNIDRTTPFIGTTVSATAEGAALAGLVLSSVGCGT
jgi:hypothetical protein